MVNSSLSPSMYDFQQTIQTGQNENYCEMSLNLSFPSFFFFCNIIGPARVHFQDLIKVTLVYGYNNDKVVRFIHYLLDELFH